MSITPHALAITYYHRHSFTHLFTHSLSPSLTNSLTLSHRTNVQFQRVTVTTQTTICFTNFPTVSTVIMYATVLLHTLNH